MSSGIAHDRTKLRTVFSQAPLKHDKRILADAIVEGSRPCERLPKLWPDRHFDDAIPPLPKYLIGFGDPLQRESVGEQRGQIIFQLNTNAPVIAGYTVSDAYPPGLDLGSVPHCTGTPRPYATMDTLFDNVFVGRTSTWRTR